MDGVENTNPLNFNITDTIKLSIPERHGYIFNGWYDENGNAVSYVPVEKAKDLTLYANWSLRYYNIALMTVPNTLTFNEINKNDVDFKAIPSGYTIYSNDIILPTLNLRGYEFEGWYNTDTNEPISKITADMACDISIKAVFIPNTYTLTLLDQGKTYTKYVTFGENYTAGTTYKEGYSFMGWYYNDQKMTSDYGYSIDVYNFLEDVTFESVFELNIYNIEVVSRYNVDIPKIPTTYTYETDTIELPILNHDGFVFNGWKTPDGQYITSIPKGSTGDIKIILDITPNRYNIKFNVDGNEVKVVEVVYASNYTVNVPEKDKIGYKFLGWYLDDVIIVDENGNSCSLYKFTYDIEVEGKWEIIEYTIELYTESTYEIEELEIPNTYTILSEVIVLPELSLKGNTFLGWKNLDSKEFITKIESNSTGNLRLEAVFEKNIYTINLSNGTSIEVEYGSNYELPIMQKEGHTFIGWYLGETQYSNEKGIPYEPFTDINDIYLEALYETNKYKVNYYNEDKLIESVEYNYGTVVTNITPPKIEGMIFIGWYSKTGDVYTEGFILENDVDLYAKYDEGYEISSLEDWNLIAQNPSGNFVLTKDINFKNEKITPIKEFKGFLNGNGYKIKSFSIGTSSVDGIYGLIIKNSGVIQNLVISDFTGNVNLSQGSNANIGIIFGENAGNISNIIIEEATISGTIAVSNCISPS